MKFTSPLSMFMLFNIVWMGENKNFSSVAFVMNVLRVLWKDDQKTEAGIPSVQKTTAGNGVEPTGTAVDDAVVSTGEPCQLM